MAKKAAQPVVYTPLIKQTPPEFIEQKVEQIPNYEDSGVKYQGKYKTQQAQNKYELRAQQTRFYTLGIGNGAFGSTLFPRSRPDLKFFCTKAIIQFHDIATHSLTLGQIHLADVKGTSASTRLYFYPVEAAGTIVLDFSDCPRLFEGENFDLYTQASLGATEFFIIQLFGWEEQP